MTSTLPRPAVFRPRHRTRPVRWTRVERSDAFRHIGPNWFAAVMGTGIVATAAVTLPWQPHGLRGAATAVWALAAVLLVVVAGAFAVHWMRHPEAARAHGRHPVMAHFYGAPPMALLTVGAGTLLLGSDVIGMRAAVAVDWVLWSAGTVLGLLTALVIPYRMITGQPSRAEAAFGGWLMPVVPPMVSAATGALLVPHLPAGQPRLTMMFACLAMFGLSLIAAVITITLIWSRLLHHGPPARESVATVWIVLGPLGQSVTAAGMLANAAPVALPDPYARGLLVFSVVFGVAVWGFAMLWLGLALAVTLRHRTVMPFNLTWWGFTFPVGTCVTGSSALYAHTGADLFAVAAVGLYVLLVGAWVIVAGRTLAGIRAGVLLRPPAPVAA
ncbi:TDT family transporter [Nocardia otitidiscaviarum]|uniref:TDT family transporter n=1 Tax=Nocardia otitidiscaviarum TaxID=1823 RepID=UPI001895B55F|nr:TDT family transporter [Nocardia otitidiscaviarum]MBF6182194.1 TDT family transporter [Nocardia otitidiscaviarum]